MTGARALLTLGLASVTLLASGLGLTDFRLSGQADSATEPAEDLNLGDCLRKTDRSQWPPAYAAICDDLLAAISGAPEGAKGKASTPRRPTPKTTASKEPAPKDVARKNVAMAPPALASVERTAALRPVPRPIEPSPCRIDATGRVTVGMDGRTHVSSTRLLSPPSVGRAPAGVALAVPAACLLESPAAGKVVFAGAFKGYNGVVIVELPQGRRLVVAGLGSLQVQRGTRIARGDILGASSDGQAPALEVAFGGGKTSVVYFDMRNRSGKPEAIPWFAAAS